jgi:ABC-2 type transport system ATP-binding protein
VNFGTTIFMTTHDMSEADELCDRIAIINRGKIAAIDTPSNLKRNVGVQEGAGGGGRNIIIIKTLSNPLTAMSILETKMGIKAEIVDNGNSNHHLGEQNEQGHYLRLVLKDVKNMYSMLLNTIVNTGIKVESIDIQRSTLDDVFLKYAGTRLQEAESREQEDEVWRNIRNVRRTFKQMG